jgi:hypothetical protein
MAIVVCCFVLVRDATRDKHECELFELAKPIRADRSSSSQYNIPDSKYPHRKVLDTWRRRPSPLDCRYCSAVSPSLDTGMFTMGFGKEACFGCTVEIGKDGGNSTGLCQVLVGLAAVREACRDLQSGSLLAISARSRGGHRIKRKKGHDAPKL